MKVQQLELIVMIMVRSKSSEQGMVIGERSPNVSILEISFSNPMVNLVHILARIRYLMLVVANIVVPLKLAMISLAGIQEVDSTSILITTINAIAPTVWWLENNVLNVKINIKMSLQHVQNVWGITKITLTAMNVM